MNPFHPLKGKPEPRGSGGAGFPVSEVKEFAQQLHHMNNN